MKENKILKSFLCDSLHIHPEELPQTLESILKSAITTVSGDTTLQSIRFPKYVPNARGVIKRDTSKSKNDEVDNAADEKLISTDEDYIPMTPKTEEPRMTDTAKPSGKLQQVQEVAELLQTAINNNDVEGAQKFAKALAEDQVDVKIEAKLKPVPQDERNKEFRYVRF